MSHKHTQEDYEEQEQQEQEDQQEQEQYEYPKPAFRKQKSLHIILGHLNIFDHVKRICQFCVGHVLFWLLVGALTVIEPLLCSQYPEGRVFRAQVLVLFLSTLCYGVQLVGTATKEWDKIVMIQTLSNVANSSAPPALIPDFTPLKLLIFFTTGRCHMSCRRIR
jgi:hypothetical protein